MIVGLGKLQNKAGIKEIEGNQDGDDEALSPEELANKHAGSPMFKEKVDITNEDKRSILQDAIDAITSKYDGIHGLTGQIKSFLEMHSQDIIDGADPVEEFNNYIDINFDSLDETDAYDNDEETQDMIDKMRKDGKDADDFVDEKKLNEEGVEDANYKMGEAFKRYGIDLSRDVIAVEMDGGTPQYGGGKLDIEPAEPAMLVAKRLERHRLDTIFDYESEGSNGDFPVMYEDGFYGDYTPEGTEHKLTYSEVEGTMWDIFQAPSGVSEKKGTDHDKDGDIDGDDYKHAKDKAIKKAMGKDESYTMKRVQRTHQQASQAGEKSAYDKKGKGKDKVMSKALKENVKAIITKVLEEDQINEAATNVLAAFGEEYAGFDGMKQAINQLENIVTDIEQYYDKTRSKIQKIYDTLGEIRNEEGLKVGGFLAPAVEQAFNRDLRPVIKIGFTKGLDTPKVKTISNADFAAARERGEIDEFTEEAPKKSVFTPVYESKKKK